jgi:hypothetical protein
MRAVAARIGRQALDSPRCVFEEQGASLKAKTQVLEKSWKCIRWKNGQRVTVTQITTVELEKFCVELDSFFDWNAKFLPTRRQQASRAIAKMDPMTGALPAPIMDLRVKEYDVLREYFEDVAHHNVHPADEVEFRPYVEALERFLIDRLRPRTTESFSNIRRLIEEGESNA